VVIDTSHSCGAQCRPGEGTWLDHQLLYNSRHSARIPDRQADSLRRARYAECGSADRVRGFRVSGAVYGKSGHLWSRDIPLCHRRHRHRSRHLVVHAQSDRRDFRNYAADLDTGNSIFGTDRPGFVASRSGRIHRTNLSDGLFHQHLPWCVLEGSRFHQSLRLVSAAAHRHSAPAGPRRGAPQKAGELSMRLSNIFELGFKELRGLSRDPMLMALIAYSFTIGIYVASTAQPETLNHAPIPIVDEDQSPISSRIVTAFNPPYFSIPRVINQHEMDSRMDAGLDTFALDIPPDFQRDLLARKSPTIQLNIDATRMTQAFTGGGYIQSIVSDEVDEFLNRYRG